MKMMLVTLAILLFQASESVVTAHAEHGHPSALPGRVTPDHVILFVLEGIDQPAIESGRMPVFHHLGEEGVATYAATTVDSSRLLPAMTSVLTGQPIGQHGITWDSFEFSRGYSRSPTLFDYLDLSGGRDSAVFFMDEALAQLAKPEPYTDYQICGPLRAECAPQRCERSWVWPCGSSHTRFACRASAARTTRGG